MKATTQRCVVLKCLGKSQTAFFAKCNRYLADGIQQIKFCTSVCVTESPAVWKLIDCHNPDIHTYICILGVSSLSTNNDRQQ